MWSFILFYSNLCWPRPRPGSVCGTGARRTVRLCLGIDSAGPLEPTGGHLVYSVTCTLRQMAGQRSSARWEGSMQGVWAALRRRVQRDWPAWLPPCVTAGTSPTECEQDSSSGLVLCQRSLPQRQLTRTARSCHHLRMNKRSWEHKRVLLSPERTPSTYSNLLNTDSCWLMMWSVLHFLLTLISALWGSSL